MRRRLEEEHADALGAADGMDEGVVRRRSCRAAPGCASGGCAGAPSARVGEFPPDFLAAGRAGFRRCAPLGVAHWARVVLEGLHNGDGTPVGD